jgi:hypothetical protein
MNLLKLISILNWTIIAILGYLVAMETIFPAKGGDAAGRGIGQAIYYLAIIALVVLLGLNLLPYQWAKYTAFGLVAIPFLFFKMRPVYNKLKRNVSNRIEASKPIFDDQERERLARAIDDGDPEKLQKLLLEPHPRLNEGGDLLAFAINSASGSYKPDEKLECLKLLFQAGARLDSIVTDVPMHMGVADQGNSKLLRLLLEKGANANATQIHFKYPIIFAAINSYQEPEASVQALLDFGANPNVTAVMDDEEGAESPLVYAARLGRWGVCVALLEKGADVAYKTQNGLSLMTYLEEANKEFHPDGYSTKEDLERLNKTLRLR